MCVLLKKNGQQTVLDGTSDSYLLRLYQLLRFLTVSMTDGLL
jgi:hypothetical protein